MRTTESDDIEPDIVGVHRETNSDVDDMHDSRSNLEESKQPDLDIPQPAGPDLNSYRVQPDSSDDLARDEEGEQPLDNMSDDDDENRKDQNMTDDQRQ